MEKKDKTFLHTIIATTKFRICILTTTLPTMKNIPFIIVFTFLAFTNSLELIAQEIPIIVPQKTLDSLQQLIKNHPKDDEQKVIWLNQYAENSIYNFELIDGINAALEARNISKTINFKGGEILYHLNIARLIGGGPRFDFHLEEAKRLSEEKGLSKNYSEITYPKALNEESLNEEYLVNKIKKQFEDALDYYTKNDIKDIQAELMSILAYFSEMQKDPEKSAYYLKGAADLHESFGQDYYAILFRTWALFSETRLENNKENIENTINDIINGIEGIEDLKQRAKIYQNLGYYFHFEGNQPALAIDYYLQSTEINENIKDTVDLTENYTNLTILYDEYKMPDKALHVGLKNIELRKALKDSTNLNMAYRRAFNASIDLKNYEKAEGYLVLMKTDASIMTPALWLSFKHHLEAQKLLNKGNYKQALPILELEHKYALEANNPWRMPQASLAMADACINLGDHTNALTYALRASDESGAFKEINPFIMSLHKTLSMIYEALGVKDKAYEHLKTYQRLVDERRLTDATASIISNEMQSALQKSSDKINQLDQERAEQIQANKIQRLWIFSIAGGLISAILILFILYRNNKSKQKANTLLNQQKEEIQNTLDQLKSTQSQLIQSEKMASLGELTAGIAHEIQNPLNFVNNFSEVSNELIDEMSEEIKKKDYDEVEAIASDLKLNLEKINHHGKRADAIVKGMLQHSRSGSTTKEQTDINKLADEYLRLAYHGLRAKDKTFNATLNTNFDEAIGTINVFPQDIGRVILNLITNAFYTVHKKKISNPENYEPTVTVKTKKSGNKVEVQVTDNGNGIPDHVLEKIFQPFFTTKPTGEGTGLGLSLSYDIVKTHGGDLKVQTKEGEGTTFTIVIPQ
jgi:two-component system NtrC family sensor kinase